MHLAGLKKRSTSIAAFSTESEAWQMFFMLVVPMSPRMVPAGPGGIGRPQQFANGRHGIFAFEHESQHGARAHELHDLRKNGRSAMWA